LVFTFIFSYLINYYIVSPIIRITERINKFKERRTPFDVEIETKDEIFELASSIENLCSSVKNQD
jgi:signal transduction histidine kinase